MSCRSRDPAVVGGHGLHDERASEQDPAGAGRAGRDRLTHLSCFPISKHSDWYISTRTDMNHLNGLYGPSSLEFRNVSLSYSAYSGSSAESGPLLSHISFKIDRGQNVAIVGPSGSGMRSLLTPFR